MKKLVLALPLIVAMGLVVNDSAFAYSDIPMGTSEATRNVSTLQQYIFEKEETLDFVNNPETYKRKRKAKNKYLNYEEGKVDVPASMQSQYFNGTERPGSNNLQFVKDENGKIKIKSVK